MAKDRRVDFSPDSAGECDSPAMTAGNFITTEASVTPLGALSNGELVFLPQACQFAQYLAPATRGRLPFSFQAEKVAGIVLWAHRT